MKLSNFPPYVFIIVFIYAIGNFYVCYRGVQALPSNQWLKISVILVSVLLGFSYFISRGLEKSNLYTLHQITYWVGTVWMAALLYFFIIVLLIDITRLINLSLHFLPEKNTLNYVYLKRISFGLAITLVFLLLTYGKWNAAHPRLMQLDISVPKQAGTTKELNIVMVSDIHLGSLFGKEKVKTIVDRIINLNPDIVFLVGDILDEAQHSIFHDNTGEPLKLLHAPLGIYAVTGNHEYIGGVSTAATYLKSLNVKLLRDTTELINNSFYVIGREDKDISRFTNNIRKPLSELVNDINHDLPLILLDHQPFALNQAVENGIDLQLSGHTHSGQFWPFTILINKIYEVSWGYKLKGRTHVYVSSGYGTWGPPIRIGNKPEIVQIKMSFK